MSGVPSFAAAGQSIIRLCARDLCNLWCITVNACALLAGVPSCAAARDSTMRLCARIVPTPVWIFPRKRRIAGGPAAARGKAGMGGGPAAGRRKAGCDAFGGMSWLRL